MIRQIAGDDILPFITIGKANGLCFAKNTVYYGYFDKEILCGFAGLLKYKHKVILKTFYVVPEYRGNGIFQSLLAYLIKIILSNGISIAEATCTEMSIREFKKRGFKEVLKYKSCVKVRNENLQ